MNLKKKIVKFVKNLWAYITKNLTLAERLSIVFTVVLVIVAIFQFKLSNDLGNIQKFTEHEKLLDSRKELRKISRSILTSFSYKGLNERLTHTPEENITLARKLCGLLLEGSANPLLAKDPKSLEHWYKAISAIEFYDYISPKDVGNLNEDGKASTASDTEVNKMVVDALGVAWQEVKKAELRMGLSSYDFLKTLERKNK